MPYERTIAHVRQALSDTFGSLDSYFDLPPDCRAFKTDAQSWSIDEILEHVRLTSHFLLIVIRNGRDKCLKRAQIQTISGDESDLTPIERIGHPDAFGWLRPDHMEPTGNRTSPEIRATLQAQYAECVTILDQLKNGEGSLHLVRMSVQQLGRLDMYGWLYFLAQHANRHTIEIERVKAAFEESRKL